MAQNSTKIVFDSNSLWKNDVSNFTDIFNTNLEDLVRFVAENELSSVELVIPEMVIQERLQQYAEVANELFKKADGSAKKLKQIGVEFIAPKKKPNLKSKLEQLARKNVKDKELTTLKIPELNQEELLQRTFNRTKPFSESDKGFKDTIIWLSILADAEKNPKTDYIICTANTKDFDITELQKEFKKVSDATLYVITDTTAIKEHLDGKYVLQLELKEKFSRVEQEVYKNVGEVMTEINQYIQRQQKDKNEPYVRTFTGERVRFSSEYIGAVSWGSNTGSVWEGVVGADFVKMDMSNISERSEGKYEIELEVEVHPRKIKEDSGRVVSPTVATWGVSQWSDGSVWGSATSPIVSANVSMSVTALFDEENQAFMVTDVYSAYISGNRLKRFM